MAEEARESIREMRKELENMPALQRRLAESLIESRIEEMKELLIDNKIRKEYKLKKAEVNTGLADELFVIPE
jgi:predicted DNA binding CopG/RHH family protein